HQTPCTVERFWGLVLVSALNEDPDRVGLRYARKVFVDGFMRHRDGFTVEVPTVPLGDLYGETMLASLARLRLQVPFNAAVRRFLIDGRVAGVELRDGSRVEAAHTISAVPWHRLLTLLPDGVIDAHPAFANLRKLEPSPITSVHLWTDRPLTALPHVVLI